MNEVRHGLGAALLADAGVAALVATRVYFTIGPETAEFPYCVFQQQAENDVWAFQGEAYRTTTWLVKGVTPVLATAEAIEQAVYVAINNVAFSAGSRRIIGCMRTGGVSYAERDAGETIWHVGGVYAVTATP